MGRLILLFVAVVGAMVLVNWLMKEEPKKIARTLRHSALWIAVAVLVLMAVTGRLHWLFALVGAILPFIGRLLGALRFFPILSQIFTQVQNARAARSGGVGSTPSGGQSQVESRYLRMTLEHDSGDMDGEILEGRFSGRRLSQLPLEELIELYDDCRASDEESAALLEAYLDRAHEQWREATSHRDAASPVSGSLTRDEACEILGVAKDADREEVIAAHRRLMQKLHPDRGGSPYLAARVNQAKDLLLAE